MRMIPVPPALTAVIPLIVPAVLVASPADPAPRVQVLRDGDGKLLMQLETADLSKLYEAGWKMPETFTVKAADGVTRLYGNMWKPFDFDPKKKYPIILHVYPGPQQEGQVLESLDIGDAEPFVQVVRPTASELVKPKQILQ